MHTTFIFLCETILQVNKATTLMQTLHGKGSTSCQVISSILSHNLAWKSKVYDTVVPLKPKGSNSSDAPCALITQHVQLIMQESILCIEQYY